MGWLYGGFVAGLLFLFASSSWAGHVADAGEKVGPNIRYAGADISNASAKRAETLVYSRSRYLLSTPIAINTGEGHLVLPAEDLGFGYLNDDVMTEIKRARYSDDPINTFISWVTALFDDITIEDRITFDRVAARQTLEAAPELTLSDPQEPRLTTAGTNYVYVRPGFVGTGIDIGALVDDLERLDLREGRVTIQAEQEAILPTVNDAYAEEIAGRINALTASGMEVIVGDERNYLNTAQLRRHIRASVGSGGVTYDFDAESLHAELERVISGPVGPFTAPTMDVIDGDVVVVTPGEAPPVCCDLGSVQQAAEGILAGGTGPWIIDPDQGEDSNLAAWADGSLVVDKVSEFTTSHSCCQPRVTNIQRMADIVRGTYLIPGETLSLNEKVKRTRDNGFVADGAIRFGSLTNEVGGGVSQFATTIFNAAFFAGLDFEEYRAHSIYFSRYPFGREATVSNPAPDLKIKNTTDYPVLVWTSYDERNITVTMYSTRSVEVEEAGQRVSRLGRCTYVETDRRRIYPDGRIALDTVEATYRPAEGLDCNGNRIRPPSRD